MNKLEELELIRAGANQDEWGAENHYEHNSNSPDLTYARGPVYITHGLYHPNCELSEEKAWGDTQYIRTFNPKFVRKMLDVINIVSKHSYLIHDKLSGPEAREINDALAELEAST